MRIQKRLQVKLQKVDVYNVEVLVVLEFSVQDFNALLVDFNGGEFKPAIEQVLREGAVTGTDLKDEFACFGGQIACDGSGGFNIEKVLSKFATACSIHDGEYRN